MLTINSHFYKICLHRSYIKSHQKDIKLFISQKFKNHYYGIPLLYIDAKSAVSEDQKKENDCSPLPAVYHC